MFSSTLTQMLPFLALGVLGVATLLVAAGGLRSARRGELLGHDRIELLRDQAERLELLREERKTLSEELELERHERLEAQRRVEQLTREHPHLELERELNRVTEELELEREGRLHNHRERQRLEAELEEERLGRSEDQRKAQREIGRLQREVQDLVEELDRLWEERREASKSSKGFWGSLFGTKNR
jgi:chromosome segregation ATPase